MNFNIRKTLNYFNQTKLFNLLLKHFESANLNILIHIMLKSNTLKKKKKFFRKTNSFQKSLLSVRNRKMHKLIYLILFIKGHRINSFQLREINVNEH